ncbi:hypothetical protein BH23PLA1_BH23PLA1_30840 [soil metagenome]
MNIPVLIEPVPGPGYRASGGPPFDLSAEGTTKDEALSRLREMIEQRIAAGAVLEFLEIGRPDSDPWARHAGMFQDDPLFDSWQEAIAEQRRLDDEASEAP